MKGPVNRRPNQRGSTMLEGALVLIPFMAMMLGVINLGLNFFLVDALQDRAMMGARHAAIYPTDTTGATNMILYGSPQGTTTGGPSPAYMGLTSSNVSIVRQATGTTSERFVVTLTGYRLPFFIPGFSQDIIGKPITATISIEAP